jgi:prevent-host-death family protein
MSKISHRGSEDARNEFSSLIEAAEAGKSTIMTGRGRPVAALAPVDNYPRSHRQQSLLALEGSGRSHWGKNSTRTLGKLRDEWGP